MKQAHLKLFGNHSFCPLWMLIFDITAIFHYSDSHETRQVPNYCSFWIIRWYLYWHEFLQVIFCYCSYTWDVQLIRGVFDLDIVFICWFRIIRVLFVVWSLYSWRSWWSKRQGVRRFQRHSGLRPFLVCPWDLPVSLMGLFFFSGKKQKSWSWNYSLQVTDYWDFRIVRCWIKGILLYLLHLWPNCEKCE